MEKSIKVFATATIANLICGYDVLGCAVHEPGDEVILKINQNAGVRLSKITGDEGKLPLDPQKNTVTACIDQYLQKINRTDLGVEVELHKKMPIGSGLGSSSASTVAGLFAINAILDDPLSATELLPFAMQGEALACGTGHADNVAPALLGGFVLIRSYEPLDVVKLPTPNHLYCAILFPEVEVPTRDARLLLKNKVPLKDAVKQWGNVAGLVSSLYSGDLELLSRSMEDFIIEPVRAILIPDFYEMRRIAMASGALTFGISGSGPTVFSFTRDEETAHRVLHHIQNHLKKLNIGSQAFVSAVNAEGPKIIA